MQGADDPIEVHRREFVARFIERGRRERYLKLISTEAGRTKLRNRLYHLWDLDQWSVTSAPRLRLEMKDVLVAVGVEPHQMVAIILSDGSDLVEGDFMSLADLRSACLASRDCAIVSVVPRRLGFYLAEDPSNDLVLRTALAAP